MALTKADVLSLSKEFIALVSTLNAPSEVFCNVYDSAQPDKNYKSLAKRAKSCKAKSYEESKASILILCGNDNSFKVDGSRAVATVCSPATHTYRVLFSCILLLSILLLICLLLRSKNKRSDHPY